MTAGQKNASRSVGFDRLASVKDPDRLGVCFDNCHVFAGGYPMGTEKEHRATMKALNTTVGLERIKAFHLNDSRRELGSRVDRHAYIGRCPMRRVCRLCSPAGKGAACRAGRSM